MKCKTEAVFLMESAFIQTPFQSFPFELKKKKINQRLRDVSISSSD